MAEEPKPNVKAVDEKPDIKKTPEYRNFKKLLRQVSNTPQYANKHNC